MSSKQRNAEKKRLRHEAILAMDDKQPDAQAIVDGFMEFHSDLAKGYARIAELEVLLQHWKERAAIAETALRELRSGGDIFQCGHSPTMDEIVGASTSPKLSEPK